MLEANDLHRCAEGSGNVEGILVQVLQRQRKRLPGSVFVEGRAVRVCAIEQIVDGHVVNRPGSEVHGLNERRWVHCSGEGD